MKWGVTFFLSHDAEYKQEITHFNVKLSFKKLHIKHLAFVLHDVTSKLHCNIKKIVQLFYFTGNK